MLQQIDTEFNLFQPTETDREELLSKLSDDILMANIQEQLDGSTINSVSYNDMLSIFDERFQFISQFYPEDENMLNRCKEIKKNIYKEIYNSIVTKFSITSELSDNYENDEFYFYTKELYNFFILKYKANLISFFVSYLYNNKKEVIREYETEEEKKDLMYRSLKKSLTNNDDILLLYHMETIIDNFVQNEDEPETVIEEIISTDEYEATNFAMKELLVENKFNTFIEKMFIEEFFKPLFNDELKYDMYSNIRNDLVTLLKHESR